MPRTRAMSGIAALMVLAACSTEPGQGTSQFPSGIYYAKALDSLHSQFGLFRIDPATRAETRIDVGPGTFINPAMAPSRRTLAYEGEVSGHSRIWLLGAFGNSGHAITPDSIISSEPAWSPSSAAIAFIGKRSGTNNNLYVMHADGSVLTQVSDDDAELSSPTWIDDSTIAVSSFRDNGTVEIETYFSFPSAPTLLTGLSDTSTMQNRGARWSPVARRYVLAHTEQYVTSLYTAAGSGGDLQLFQAGASGRNFGDPDWSADGSRIVATSYSSFTDFRLLLFSADGMSVDTLLGPGNQIARPSWVE